MKGLTFALLMVLLLPTGASASVLPIFQAAAEITSAIEVLRGDDPRDAMVYRAVTEADGLRGSERQHFYKQETLPLAAPASRALIIGFGSGAARIGDEKGQVLGAWGDGIGLTAVLSGAAVVGIDWTANRFGEGIANFGSSDLPPYEMSSFGSAGLTMIKTGGIIMVSSRIFDAARVMIWGSGYNRRLKHSLETELAVSPDAGITASARLRW